MQTKKTREKFQDHERAVVQPTVSKAFIGAPKGGRLPAFQPTEEIGDKARIEQLAVYDACENEEKEQESRT